MEKPTNNTWPMINLIVSLILLAALGWFGFRLNRLETKLSASQAPASPLTVVIAGSLTPVTIPVLTVQPVSTAQPVYGEAEDGDSSENPPETSAQTDESSKISNSGPKVMDQVIEGRDWGAVTSNAAFGAHRGIVPLFFNGKLFALGGERSDSVWSSVNGSNWEETASRFYISSLCYGATVLKGRLWAVGQHFVVSSLDGIHWDLVNDHPPFGNRNQITLTAFNDRLWMIGGVSSGIMNDVWCSADGKNWDCALVHAPFPERRAASTAVFQGKLWITGGIRNSVYTPLDDIWNSSDGYHWQQVKAGPHYEGRHCVGFTAFHNKLWVIGGDNGEKWGGVSDVWSSPDGIQWDCVNRAGPFGGRVANSAVVYQGRIWIMGGDDAQVWCTPPLENSTSSQ